MILNKKKIYLVLIIWSVIFGLLIRFGFLPFFGAIKESSQELAFEKEALEFFQLRIKDFENFQKNYSLYQPILEKIENSFVDREVPIEFIEFLENQAGNSNLSIEIFPLNITRTESDPWPPVSFQVSLGGSFSNCSRFLERLEQSSFLVEITELTVQRIGEKKAGTREFEGLGAGNVSFILKLKVFSKEIS